MHAKILTRAVSFLLVFAMADRAFSWNKAGHMTVAAIAYTELKRTNPSVVAKVIDILREHPHYESRWEPQLQQRSNDDERGMLLFMLAARWPDDIRGDQDFDRPSDHFIDYPFKPAGQPDSVHTSPPEDENILVSFARNVETAKDDPNDNEKAIAICWILHQVGDVHQPLHTTTMFTTEFPEGDRGGTRLYIRPKQNAGTVSLHKYWDDLILGSENFQDVKNRSIVIRQAHPRSEFTTQLMDGAIENWAKDSAKFAREVAHKNGALQGSTNLHNGKVLPNGYAEKAKTTAETQVGLAGYRLARVLKDL